MHGARIATMMLVTGEFLKSGENMAYIVEFEDNEGNDGLEEFESEWAAETAIQDDLKVVKQEFCAEHREYDLADFINRVEIWEIGGDKYVCWRRTWLL